MEESLKDRLILILAISSIIFFMVMVGSCSNLRRLKLARDKEMATRLDFEEKTNKLMQEKTVIEERLNKLNQELEKEKLASEATGKTLLQEQLVNQSLKEELEKITKLKETLEEDLKEALIKGKSAKPK